jgi:predicted DNA-binding transcriptional regulator AlpA
METRQPASNPDARASVRTADRPLPAEGFVRQSALIPHIVPFSPATLWRKVKSKDFPAPVKLSARITAWRVHEIREWLQSQK